MNSDAIGARPPSSQAEAQRERILDAAQKCFIERGFHAASIASIAETAGMSAGLMYRYFENKSAIVKAIIERELAGKRAKVEQLYTSAEFLARILGTVRQWQAADPAAMNAPLFLEMSAEATRDRDIAEAIRSSDLLVRQDFERWLARSRDRGGLGLSKALAHKRAILVQCLIEGLAVRAVREPDLDLKSLQDALAPLLQYLGLAPTSEPVPDAEHDERTSAA